MCAMQDFVLLTAVFGTRFTVSIILTCDKTITPRSTRRVCTPKPPAAPRTTRDYKHLAIHACSQHQVCSELRSSETERERVYMGAMWETDTTTELLFWLGLFFSRGWKKNNCFFKLQYQLIWQDPVIWNNQKTPSVIPCEYLHCAMRQDLKKRGVQNKYAADVICIANVTLAFSLAVSTQGSLIYVTYIFVMMRAGVHHNTRDGKMPQNELTEIQFAIDFACQWWSLLQAKCHDSVEKPNASCHETIQHKAVKLVILS